MKIFLLILIAIIIGASGGYFSYKYFIKDGTGQVNGDGSYNEPFMWGVTMRSDALGRYINEIWLKEIKAARNLGVDHARIAWNHNGDDEMAYNEEILNYLIDGGLQVYLIVEPKGDFEKVQNPYQDGYDNLTKIATKYKGKIKYYQLLNESGSLALKGGQYSGEKDSDYDPAKYERVKEWLKGASVAVKQSDPAAFRIITNQWTHTAFLDKIKKDEVEYDLIGWDWFSDMGFIGDKTLEGGTKLIDKLKSFGKPILLAEINYRPEGRNGQKGQPEEKQADYIAKTADWAVKNKLVGFYVLELLDVVNAGGRGYTDYYGIVSVKKSTSGTYVPGDPRQAYTKYQEIIKKYKNNQL
ncbi:MAG: hypothetical protein HW405_425 [Candidatus Berkelbacteria bacterium]|nr:hypothetical protein [Candidatus Berkelbacteria bacterium]